jgi:hypothetical protein
MSNSKDATGSALAPRDSDLEKQAIGKALGSDTSNRVHLLLDDSLIADPRNRELVKAIRLNCDENEGEFDEEKFLLKVHAERKAWDPVEVNKLKDDFGPQLVKWDSVVNQLRDFEHKREAFRIGRQLEEGSIDPDVAAHRLGELAKRKGKGSWGDPEPLPGVPKVESFDPDSMLPGALAAWVKDTAERMQCPIDYPAVAIVAALSGVVMRRCGIRPKANDNWTVIPTVWALIVGRPGAMKSPPVNAAMAFLERIESYWHDDYLEELKDYRIKEWSFANAEKVYEKKIKAAWEKGNKSAADELSAELEKDRPEEPIHKRLLVGDTTHQKLGMLLQDNPNGLLMRKDELRGWLKEMNEEKHAEARSFFVTAWNGDGSVTFDRVGRGHTRIEGAAVSIIGNIQPGPLKAIVEAGCQDDGDDGFLSRFQLAVVPEDYYEKQWIDRRPDSAVQERVQRIFERLAHASGDDLGAMTEEVEVPFVRFKDDAQAAFQGSWEKTQAKLKEDLHPALQSLLSKYPKLIPSLALLFSLGDGKKGSVDLVYLKMAFKWEEYLFSHAQRIYGIQTKIEEAVSILAEKVRSGAVLSGMTLREIKRKGWSGLKEESIIESALDELEELHWLKVSESPTSKSGGRPSVRVRLNPVFWNTPLGVTANTDKTTL